MPRATNGPASRRRRNNRLKLAKGFKGSRSKLFRQATESVDRAQAMAYVHRKVKKRSFRQLWIVRMNAACRLNGISYSRFVDGCNICPHCHDHGKGPEMDHIKMRVLMERNLILDICFK